MKNAVSAALSRLDFTAIDFETANEQRESACAIGVAVVRSGRIVETYQTLLRPRELRVDWRNFEVHGIPETALHDAPTLADVWPDLLPHLHWQPVVAHNSAFDVSVLEHTLRAYAVPMPAFHCLCSVKLARAAWPQLERHRLNHLAEFFGLELDHHDALSDARACAEITVRALRAERALPLCFKQRELTAGLAARVAKLEREQR